MEMKPVLFPDEMTYAAPEERTPVKAGSYDKATVYMPRGALKRIKQMALDNDKRVNDFLQEGVDMMLAKYGQPSLKQFAPK